MQVFADHAYEVRRQLVQAGWKRADGGDAHHCSLIRLGKRVPHPRHWEALATLVQSDY